MKKKDNRGRKPRQRKAGTESIVPARFVRRRQERLKRRESFERAHNLSPLPRTHENVYRDRWNNDRGRPSGDASQLSTTVVDDLAIEVKVASKVSCFTSLQGLGLLRCLQNGTARGKNEAKRFNFQGTKRVSRDVGGKNGRDPGRKGWRKVFSYFEIKENAESPIYSIIKVASRESRCPSIDR